MRRGGRLQRDGDGAAGAQSGGPVQLLLPEVQPQNGPAAGGPDGTDSLKCHLPVTAVLVTALEGLNVFISCMNPPVEKGNQLEGHPKGRLQCLDMEKIDRCRVGVIKWQMNVIKLSKGTEQPS